MFQQITIILSQTYEVIITDIIDILLLVVFEELVQISELLTSHLCQQSSELILPFITVTEKGKFERGTIQEDKLDVEYCLLLLYIIGYLCIPV